MIFAPFTGVNHHMQSAFFGAAFIANEKIESYEWLFRTFLSAMGGKGSGKRKKIAVIRNKVEDSIQRAKSSSEAMDFLVSSVLKIDESLRHIVPSTMQASQQEYENFIGCQIPEQIQIHHPNDVRSKGRSKRIKRAKELPKSRKGKNVKKDMKDAAI
jgi:hypothetical protein